MKNKFKIKLVLSVLLSAVLLASTWQGNFLTAEPVVITEKIFPNDKGEFYDNWIVFTTLGGSTDKAVVVGDNSDDTGISRTANAKRQTYDMNQNEIPPNADITNVKMVARAKSGLAGDKIQLTVVKGTTSQNISDGPLKEVDTSFGLVSRDLPTDPFTGLNWTAAQINGMTSNGNEIESGVNNQQQQNSVLMVAEFYWEVSYIDPNPPTGTITINNGDASTTANLVSVTLTCSDNGESGCASVRITADGGVTFTESAISDSPPSLVINITLPPGRGEKTVTAYFKDAAGNESGPISDTIMLDASISSEPPDNTNPTWGVDTVTVIGTVTNSIPGDRVRVDWGSPTTTVNIVAGAWNADFIYPKDAVLVVNNPHTIVATLVDSSDNVVSNSDSNPVSATAGQVTVGKQTATLELDDRLTPPVNTPFTILGTLIGQDGNGVEGGTVTFSGTGAGTLADATSGGLTFASNIEVTPTPPPDSDNILRLKKGDTITLPPNTVRTTITTKDMGDNKIEFKINGNDADRKKFVGSPSGGPIEDYVQRGAGISELEVVDILDSADNPVLGGIGGISKIKASSALSKILADVDFPNTVSPAVPALSFNLGYLSSTGTAPATVSCSLDPCIDYGVTGNFAGNSYYEGDDDTIFYQTTENNGGLGATVTLIADSGITTPRSSCDPFVDSDGGSGSGATGTVTASSGVITAITITAGGSGYTSGQVYNIIPLTGDGSSAAGTVTASSGVITAITITVGGSGYTTGQGVNIIPLGGDRICDDWEINGIPYSSTSYVLPDADTTMKNIWVEIDYMEGYAPNEAAIIAVKNVLLTHNIKLNYIIDEQVPAFSPLTIWTSANGVLDDFDSYKAAYFGTSAERGDADAASLLTAKGQAYRYFLWVNSIGGSTGVAEGMGNDAVVAIGGLATSQNAQAGTFMHELGHLLNLNHGGPNNWLGAARSPPLAQASVNCKPIYESVMSYSRQWDYMLTGANWNLDWSIGRYGNLREYLLPSALTLSGVTTATVPIVIGTPSAGAGTYTTISSPLSAIDWNGSVSGTGQGANLDVNNFNIYGCGATVSNAFTPSFTDPNDYAHLDFAFQDLANGYFDGHDETGETSVHTEFISETTDDVILQVQIDNINFVALVPPPAEDGTGNKKEGSVLPIKVEAETNDGQGIVGATLNVHIYSSSAEYGIFLMPTRNTPSFYQYDWDSSPANPGETICIDVTIERPGSPPTQILLLPDTPISCNERSVTNKVLLT